MPVLPIRRATAAPRAAAAGLPGAIAAALCAFVAGCGHAGSTRARPPRLHVATYNVNFGMPDPASAAAAIRQLGAHVVCLQETTDRWQAYLEARLGDLYPHRRFLRPKRGGGGMGVLSKCPLDGFLVLPPVGGGWFPAWRFQADTPAGTVQFLNVHLRPALSEAYRPTVGAYLTTSTIRRREVRHHLELLDLKLPTIVLGDFNEGDAAEAVCWLKRQGFTDALAGFDAWSPTWVWPLRWTTLQGRLDRILFSGHLRCLHARVLRAGASDHYPVAAVLARRPA